MTQDIMINLETLLNALKEATNNKALHRQINSVLKAMKDIDNKLDVRAPDFRAQQALIEKGVPNLIAKILSAGEKQVRKKENSGKQTALQELKEMNERLTDPNKIEIQHADTGLTEEEIKQRTEREYAKYNKVKVENPSVEQPVPQEQEAKEPVNFSADLLDDIKKKGAEYSARADAREKAAAAREKAAADTIKRDEDVQKYSKAFEELGLSKQRERQEESPLQKPQLQQLEAATNHLKVKITDPFIDALNAYQGSHKKELGELVAIIVKANDKREYPHIIQKNLLAAMEEQLKTIESGKKGLYKLIHGKYSKLLAAQIKQLKSYQVDYTGYKAPTKGTPAANTSAPEQEAAPKPSVGTPPPTLKTPTKEQWDALRQPNKIVDKPLSALGDDKQPKTPEPTTPRSRNKP